MASPKTLSVSEAAAFCRVGRTTVGYWVRSKKLFARRVGRNYTIPVEDLLHFLKAAGQPIPPELGNGNSAGPVFKSFQNCWQYWQEGDLQHSCERCLVSKRQVLDCFSIRDNGASGCPQRCQQCRYYQDMFMARFQFIHQIDFPAAVFKGLSLWGGNEGWAALCDLSPDNLIGRGIETIIHPSSLAEVISVLKRTALGERTGMVPGAIYIASAKMDKRPVSAWVFPLREPDGTFLMLALPLGTNGGGTPLSA